MAEEQPNIAPLKVHDVNLTSLQQLQERNAVSEEALEKLRRQLRRVYQEDRYIKAQALNRSCVIDCSISDFIERDCSWSVKLSDFVDDSHFYPSKLGCSAEKLAARYSLDHCIVTSLHLTKLKYRAPLSLYIGCSSSDVFMDHLNSTKATFDEEWVKNISFPTPDNRSRFGVLACLPGARYPVRAANQANANTGLRDWNELTYRKTYPLRKPTAYLVDDVLQYYAGVDITAEDLLQDVVLQPALPSAELFAYVPLNSSLAAVLRTWHTKLGAKLHCDLPKSELKDQSQLVLRFSQQLLQRVVAFAEAWVLPAIPYENPRDINFMVEAINKKEIIWCNDHSPPKLLREDMREVDPESRVYVEIGFQLRYFVVDMKRRSHGSERCEMVGKYIPLGGPDFSDLDDDVWMHYGRRPAKKENPSQAMELDAA